MIDTLVTGNDSPEIIRAKIARFEELCRSAAAGLPLIEPPVRHTFTTGAYVREITMEAGLVIVGKIHRHDHLNFISSGDVTVVTESDGVQRLTGPCTLISKAGTKRVLYTHARTIWTTVHVTEETDIEKIEGYVIAKNYTEIGMAEPDMGLLALQGDDL